MLNLYLEDIAAVKNVDIASGKDSKQRQQAAVCIFNSNAWKENQKGMSVHKSHESIEPASCLAGRIFFKSP